MNSFGFALVVSDVKNSQKLLINFIMIKIKSLAHPVTTVKY